MKTVKPTRLGILCKTFENDGKCYFVVTLLVFFPFGSPSRLLPEPNLWKLVGAELGDGAIFDECMPKLRGELLVTGKCFTPGGVPRPASSVRVQLGALDKTLYVIGDRQWKFSGPSDPAPFTEMPLTYAKAFGGEGYPQNPLGKGIAPIRVGEAQLHPLPNIEDPKHLIRSPKDKPPPAGFDPYDLTWPQRFSKVGTYDAAWFKKRYPGFAADLDWSFFNTAPMDQQIEGFFQGGEAFVIENMHPEKPRLEGTLPKVTARCFITQRTSEGEVFREIPTRIDTIRFFPHRERGILVFRGVTTIQEDDADDVVHLIAGCEAAGEAKPPEHYQEALAKRLDKEKGYLYLMREADLMPPPDPDAPAVPDEKLSDMDDILAREDIAQQNLRRGAELRLEQLRKDLMAEGIQPPAFVALPPPEKPPRLEEMPEYVERLLDMAEKEKVETDKKRAAAEAEVRAECAAVGVDFDKLMAQAKKKSAGPPKFSAKAEMERLKDTAEMARNGGVDMTELEARLADPELERKLILVEQQLLEVYRKFAHHFPAASRRDDDEGPTLREEVAAGHKAGQSFAGRDLTGLDLSGLDLRGIDLTNAMLEAASLAGADLGGAKLQGAVLARADLTGAKLEGANLNGANLGSAKLAGAQMSGGVDLSGAVLHEADLTGANLAGARLNDADLSEATLDGADLTAGTAKNLLCMNVDLSRTKLAGASFETCSFLNAKLEGADLTGAKLVSCVFVTCQGDGAVLRGAKADNIRVVRDSSFAGADFQGASLQQANFRGTNLEKSNFADTNLRGADLSGCNLRNASLERAIAVDAMLVRTDLTGANLTAADLMQTILQKAIVGGAVFDKASLFRADAAKMRGDSATSMKGALVKRVRVVTTGGGTDGQA